MLTRERSRQTLTDGYDLSTIVARVVDVSVMVAPGTARRL